MAADVGTEAPDFTLRDEQGEQVTLSDLRGRNVALMFFPFAFSGMCTKEMHDISGLQQEIDSSTAQVFGVSVDSPFALKAFRNAEHIAARLLADFEPKGEVARRYGVCLDNVGAATRATFVLDKDGKIVYKTVNELGQVRDPNEVVDALASCLV